MCEFLFKKEESTMRKKTEKEVRQEVERLLKEIALFKEDAQRKGFAFSSLSEEELVKKVRGESSNSPFMCAQGWSGGGPAGDEAGYSVTIYNPDPEEMWPVFVTIFFGLGNFFDDIAQAWIGRDTRWPTLSTEQFTLEPGVYISQNLKYIVPIDIPSSTYLGNSVLWYAQLHDKGDYLDRSLFWFNLH
jgi:hypothetical protein